MLLRKIALILTISLLAGLMTPAPADNTPTVLITGGNRGLGLAWVEKYTARGWQVVATARRPEAATALQALAKDTGLVRIEPLDVTVPESVQALAERLDGLPIDILINNAGMLGDEEGQQFGSIDPSQFDTFMRVNALGALLVTEQLLPNLRAGRLKKVAGISAVVASFDVYPRIHHGLYFYKASKVALNMILRNIAMETREDGIAVAVLSPGVVNTSGQTPDTDIMSPEMRRSMVDIDTSVGGMMRVMDELTLEGSGKWYRYNGEVIAW